MRILANENVTAALVRALRVAGHDVLWILESYRGSSDEKILALSKTETRILLTCDKDFGELAYHHGLPPGVGIILLRVALKPSPEMMKKTAAVISSRDDWAGKFSVIESDRIRMRTLP